MTRVLAVGGFEPLGQVGLLADAEAIRALGGAGVLVPTCSTIQSGGMLASEPVSPRFLAKSLRAIDGVAAVKVGVVPSVELLRAVIRNVSPRWWVIDPVVRSSRALALSRLKPEDYGRLARPNVVLTPNAIEAGWLLGTDPPRTAAEAVDAAGALLRKGFGAVVVKGGHLEGAPVDVLAWKGRVKRFVGKRWKGKERRGTGCRFGSALATVLAQGSEIEIATLRAHRWIATFGKAQPARF